VAKQISAYASFIYGVLKLKGFTRTEFIIVNGIPHLLEVNTTPGMTIHSILPQQAKAAGISLEQLFESLSAVQARQRLRGHERGSADCRRAHGPYSCRPAIQRGYSSGD